MATEFKMKKLDNGNLRTCEVRLSYPELFTAKAVEEGGKPKFSTSILFPKGADLTVLKNEIKAVVKEAWGDKPPKGLRIGLRDQGEKDSEGYEEGAFFLNCNSIKRPPVVNRKREPITDEEDVYPGIWAIVTLKVYAFKPKKGDKYAPGVGFGLQAVQIIKDGERLGGGYADPNEEFEELEELAEGDSADAIFGDGSGGEEDADDLGIPF
jgi:hypothetical protein